MKKLIKVLEQAEALWLPQNERFLQGRPGRVGTSQERPEGLSEGGSLPRGFSDSALAALARIYVSLQTLAEACAPGELYAGELNISALPADILSADTVDTDLLRARLECCFALARRRCRKSAALRRRSLMVLTMCEILHASPLPQNEKRTALCYQKICDLLQEAKLTSASQSDTFSAAKHAVKAAAKPAAKSDVLPEHLALRCIAELFAYVDEADRTGDEYYEFYRRRVSEWGSALNDRAENALSADRAAATTDRTDRTAATRICAESADGYEALCRLDVLVRHSNLYADSSYEAQAEACLVRLCRRTIDTLRSRERLTVADCERLALLGETLKQTSQHGALNELAELAERHAERLPKGSEEWLLCRSVSVTNACRTITARIKQQVLGRTA